MGWNACHYRHWKDNLQREKPCKEQVQSKSCWWMDFFRWMDLMRSLRENSPQWPWECFPEVSNAVLFPALTLTPWAYLDFRKRAGFISIYSLACPSWLSRSRAVYLVWILSISPFPPLILTLDRACQLLLRGFRDNSLSKTLTLHVANLGSTQAFT